MFDFLLELFPFNHVSKICTYRSKGVLQKQAYQIIRSYAYMKHRHKVIYAYFCVIN